MSKFSSLFLCITLVLINVSVSLAHNHDHEHSGNKKVFDIQKKLLKFLPQNPMVAALCSVVYITMIPLVLLKFLPNNLPKSMLNALLAFALGTVLGDVFLHMIPELMSSPPENEKSNQEGHHHSEHLVDVGMLILGGIVIFYVLEKIVDIFGGDHDHESHSHKHSHSKHHHDNNLENKQEYADKIFSSKNDDQYFGEDEMNSKKNNNGLKKRKPLKKRERENSSTFITSKTIEKEQKAKIDNVDSVSSSSYVKAIMQVTASMTHGFTDGLSVTFAFISSPSAGLTTAFAMFLHEIPHKFGDFTIMRQLGFSSRRALLMQFISAFGTMLGSIIACIIFWMSSSSSSISINDLCDNYIMPMTAGSLIYLALVGMLPELINYQPRGALKSLVQIVIEVVFFGMGACIMRWIALNE